MIQKTLLLPYLQRASKKIKVLDLQGATFAQKLSCAQSIFIFSFNLYHVFVLLTAMIPAFYIHIYVCIYVFYIYVYVRVQFEF